jgi:hypothetical protein
VAVLSVTLALSPAGALAQTTNPADDGEARINFEDRPVGGPPSSFDTGLTGKGGPVRWVLLEDGGRPERTRGAGRDERRPDQRPLPARDPEGLRGDERRGEGPLQAHIGEGRPGRPG